MKFRIIHPDFRVDFESALGLDMELVELNAMVGEWNNPSHLVFILDGTLWMAPFVDFTVQYECLSEGEDDFPTSRVMNVWFVYHGNDPEILEAARRQRERDLKR